MKVSNKSNSLIDGYMCLLENFNSHVKLDLISRLTISIKKELSQKKNSFGKAFGSFESKKTADQIINEIRSSRVFRKS